MTYENCQSKNRKKYFKLIFMNRIFTQKMQGMNCKMNNLFKKSIFGFLIIASFCSNAVFAQVPTITSFSPASGAVGSTVTISGTNFDTTAGLNVVYFGSTQAVVNNASQTQLTVTVPASKYIYF